MLTLWKNPWDLATIRSSDRLSNNDYLNRLFDDTVKTAFDDLFSYHANSIGIESIKSDTGITVNVDVPGIKLSDIKVEIIDQNVQISAERKTKSAINTITKSFTIPINVDQSNIEADLADGILSLKFKYLPTIKKEAKTIEIKQR